MSDKNHVETLSQQIHSHYQGRVQALGFKEYLEIFFSNPSPQCRGSAAYVRDTFDYFGSQTLETSAGKVKRFRLFDVEFFNGVGRVSGQEEAQGAIYRLLNNFVREKRVNRLILLHGPNGSAKTSLIHAIIRGLEHYSNTSEGALYQFRWIFPSDNFIRSHIGFGDSTPSEKKPAEPVTYARLPAEDVDAVLECELKDHPLLLIPAPQRLKLLENLQSEGKLDPNFQIPDYLLHGDLCPKCRQVHDALLAAYGGDSNRVLQHVQVHRLLLSMRYRRGVSSVEPQLQVDAAEQQITASRGLASLPPAIAHLALFEYHGALVDANRGLLEYNDLLKRPIDTFKYLLVTCESGQATLDRSTLFLDSIFIGSTNEMLLDSFKSYADFASFKGRLELVRVPYLRRVSEELQIYQEQLPNHSVSRHLAPHTLYLASLWAVLTRLRRPDTGAFSGELREVIRNLTPLQKALLLDSTQAPPQLSSALARELVGAIPSLYESLGNDYEGRTGASAREVRMLLLNTAQCADKTCVTPLSLFEEIKGLLADKTVFDFLQRKPEGDYLDQEKILQMTEDAYLDRLEDEAAEALGMVSKASYSELFNRYIVHVSHWLKKETLNDPVTGQNVPPDEELMKEVEAIIATSGEDATSMRKSLISRIGAYVLEPERSGKQMDSPPDYSRIFPQLFERMKSDFVTKRRVHIQRNYRQFLSFLDGQELEPRSLDSAKKMLSVLTSRFGYCSSCAQEAIAFLLKKRYQD